MPGQVQKIYGNPARAFISDFPVQSYSSTGKENTAILLENLFLRTPRSINKLFSWFLDSNPKDLLKNPKQQELKILFRPRWIKDPQNDKKALVDRATENAKKTLVL